MSLMEARKLMNTESIEFEDVQERVIQNTFSVTSLAQSSLNELKNEEGPFTPEVEGHGGLAGGQND